MGAPVTPLTPLDDTFTLAKDPSSGSISFSSEVDIQNLTRLEQNVLLGQNKGDSIRVFNDRRGDPPTLRPRREERDDSWHEQLLDGLSLANLKRVKQMDQVDARTNKRLNKLAPFH